MYATHNHNSISAAGHNVLCLLIKEPFPQQQPVPPLLCAGYLGILLPKKGMLLNNNATDYIIPVPL